MQRTTPTDEALLIDSQHRALFDQLRRVATVYGRGGAAAATGELAEFDRLIRVHFREEEELLGRLSYPDLDAHRVEHDTFLSELQRDQSDELDPASLAFLRGWLVNHTMGCDRLYDQWLSDRAAKSQQPGGTSSGAGGSAGGATPAQLAATRRLRRA